MSAVATAIIGTAVMGGLSARQKSKDAKANIREGERAQAATDKKDAMFSLMSVMGGQGATGMSPTTPIDQTKGPSVLQGALGGAFQGLGTGMGMKQGMDAAADRSAYTQALTGQAEGSTATAGHLNQWLGQPGNADKYFNRSSGGGMPPWMAMMGMGGANAGPAIGGYTPTK